MRQGHSKLRGRLVPCGGIFLQSTHHDDFDVAWKLASEDARGWTRGLVDLCEHDCTHAFPAKWGLRAQEKIQHLSQRVDVGARVRRLAFSDFRGHVLRCSHDQAASGHRHVDAAHLCDPEIDDLHEVVLAAQRGEK